MIRDVSNAKVIKQEPRGANPKVWLDLEYKGRKRSGLFKPTYVRPDGTNTLTHYGELLYADICKMLDFPCAEIELAQRNGQIGCISYNVLENLPENNADYTRYNLIDMVSIIQRIRANFDPDPKVLKVKNTSEHYSLDLIMEAVDNYISDPAQRRAYRDWILELCLIDSATDYRDRHASNLGAGEERISGNVFPIEIFDNGPCYGLHLKMDELRETLNGEDAVSKIRSGSLSKIGIDTMAPVPFERLETLIFNHYFDEVEPIYQKFQRNFDVEKIRELLQDPKYDGLDPIYKESIIRQSASNKKTMQERYEKSKLRREIEAVLDSDESKEHINARLAVFFESEDFSISGDILDDFAIQTIRNIEHIPDEFKSGVVKLSHEDKNVALWAILATSIMKRMDPNLPHDAKKALIADFMKRTFNFCQNDLEKIQRLADVYEYKLDIQSPIEVRKFIYGTKGENGLGEENIGPFIAFKLAEVDVSERHRERYSRFIELYGDVLEKEKMLSELVPHDKARIEIFKRIGITDNDEMYEVLYDVIDDIKREKKRFKSEAEFKAFVQERAKKTFEGRKTHVNGILIDNSIKDIIDNSTYTLDNGKKVTVLTETMKNSAFLASVLGSSFVVSIGQANNGNGRSLVITADAGEELPKEVLDFTEKIKVQIQKEYGRAPNGHEFTYKQGEVPRKAGKQKHKNGPVISIAAGKTAEFSLSQTPEELKKMVLGMFKAKERDIG